MKMIKNIDAHNKKAITAFSPLKILLSHSHNHSLVQQDQSERPIPRGNQRSDKRKKSPSK